MAGDTFPYNPRERLYDPDPATRRMAVAAIAREPLPEDREFFEETLFSADPATALLAHLGLRALVPPPASLDQTWRETFAESVELLVQRASSGPVQLRVAALQALAFAPEGLTVGLVDRVLQSLPDAATVETGLWREAPTLPLVQVRRSLDLPEGFALLLSALPLGKERIHLLRRELGRKESHRLLPVLIALQLVPVPELTDQVLACVRSGEPRVAIEAARALLACGGKKVYLMILSLLKETVDPRKKAGLLPLAAQTGRREVWQVLLSHLRHSSPIVRRAAVVAVASFPGLATDKTAALAPLLKDKEAGVACEAARFLWQFGSMEALTLLEDHFRRGDPHQRAVAAELLGELPAETAAPILIEEFGKERHGDVIRQIILSLRRLLPHLAPSSGLCDRLLPVLRRLLGSTDPFNRSQAAVLAGILGAPAEDLLLSAIEKPEHPHVLASLLAGLGRIGHGRLLVLARFHDHPDPRVRANLMTALLSAGPGAIPYLTTALKDPSPRVGAAAAHSLFMLGQVEVVAVLNRMLLVPSPVSVLAACHALGRLLRVQVATLPSDHPLALTLGRRARTKAAADPVDGPALLRAPELPRVFEELALARGDREKTAWVLENHLKANPASVALRRMLASVWAVQGKAEPALNLLETCLRDHPGVLADLLDAYRLSLLVGDLPRAEAYGQRVQGMYRRILDACLDLCQSLRGRGTEALLERLHSLSSPSMNIYAAMIQLKALQGDTETVLELLTEILLARPANGVVAQKLANLLPESLGDLRQALLTYVQSLPVTPASAGDA